MSHGNPYRSPVAGSPDSANRDQPRVSDTWLRFGVVFSSFFGLVALGAGTWYAMGGPYGVAYGAIGLGVGCFVAATWQLVALLTRVQGEKKN